MANMTWQERSDISQKYSKEPLLPMWLVYQCPYTPLGKTFNCPARSRQAQDKKSSFLANKRTLSQEHGTSQVCSQFTNAIILHETVPHVASLMAEVKFRYTRQLVRRHNITSWQPPMWDIKWWQTYGPALVGNYATRTLLGRDSFCRSARNLSRHDLAHAIDALLGFDMVMTLDRARDIDVLVSIMLGWRANFSSQPASRKRAVRPTTVYLNWNDMDDDKGPESSSSSSSQRNLHGGQQQQEGSGGGMVAWLMNLERSSSRDSTSTCGGVIQTLMQPVWSWFRLLLQQVLGRGPTSTSNAQLASRVHTNLLTRTTSSAKALVTEQVPATLNNIGQIEDADKGDYAAAAAADGDDDDDDEDDDDDDNDDDDGTISDAEFEPTAAAKGSFTAESAAAVALVRSSWQECQAHLWGFKSLEALGDQLLPEPEVEYMNEVDRHGAFLVLVVTTLPATGSIACRRGAHAGGTTPNSNAQRVAPGQESSRTPGSSDCNNNNNNNNNNSTGEIWHAFPRHNVALTDADMSQLEEMTQLDHELVNFAGVLFDLDTIWLQSLVYNPHYRKRMKSIATTNTACGFAGMLPLADLEQNSVFQPDALSQSGHWII